MHYNNEILRQDVKYHNEFHASAEFIALLTTLLSFSRYLFKLSLAIKKPPIFGWEVRLKKRCLKKAFFFSEELMVEAYQFISLSA